MMNFWEVLTNCYKKIGKLIDALFFPETGECLLCGRDTEGKLCDKHKELLLSLCELKYREIGGFSVLSVFRYEGIAADCVRGLKYRGRRYLAPMMAEMMKENLKLPKFDLACAVPLHWARKLMRGFNQSELLLKELVGEEKYSELLQRTRYTRPQARLSAERRQENVRNAFRMRDISVEGKRILLFDDVVTTGSTALACARLLIENGAEDVYILSFAAPVIKGEENADR